MRTVSFSSPLFSRILPWLFGFIFALLGLWIGFLWGRNNGYSHKSNDLTNQMDNSLTEEITSPFSNLKLSHVRFRWTKTRFIETKNLELTAIPFQESSPVNLDDPNSFYFLIQKGTVSLGLDTLEEIFNDSVFSYKESPLRKIKLSSTSSLNDPPDSSLLRLEGEMNLGVWLGFQMDCRLGIVNNRIHLLPVSIKTLGIPFVKPALDWVNISLSSLLPIKPGMGAEIVDSIVVINPYLLFRSPSIQGNLESVDLKDEKLLVQFRRKNPSTERPSPILPTHSIYLWGGRVKFGKLLMEDAKILLEDTNKSNLFDFYLRYYNRSLVAGKAQIQKDGGIVVDMPDFFE